MSLKRVSRVHGVASVIAGVLCFGLFFSLTGSLFAADTYTWQSTVTDGDWQESANWTSTTGSSYPGDEDTFKQAAVDSTIHLKDDVTVAIFTPAASKVLTLDLDGHTLELTTAAYKTYIKGNAATSRGSITSTYGLCVSNGTFKINRPIIGDTTASPNSGFLDLTGVTFIGRFWEWCGGSRVNVREGSVWEPDGDIQIGPSYYRVIRKWAHLYVDGPTSRVDAPDYNLTIGNIDSGHYLVNGAKATWNNIEIGGTFRATNAFVSVDSSTLTVGGTLKLGSDAINQTAGTTYLSDINLTRGSTLFVKGTSARVAVAGALAIYAKTSATIDITVPSSGFEDANGAARAPISVGSLSLVARNADYPDNGPTQLKITSRDWCVRHSEGTMTLLAFDEAEEVAVRELLDNVVLTDYSAEEVSAGLAPVVSLGADEKSIVLTAPVALVDPVFTVRTDASTDVGTKTVRLTVTDYGELSSSIVAANLEVSTDPSYASAFKTNLLANASAISGSLPQTLRYAVAGGFEPYVRYYGRLTLVTDEGFTGVGEFWFDGNDGIAETLTWSLAEDGVWQDGAKWSVNSVIANRFPRGEDSIKMPYGNAAVTFALSEDAEIFKFDGSAQWPCVSSGTRVFDLNGHTFSIAANYTQIQTALTVGGGGTDIDNLEPNGATIVFRNGRVELPDPQVSGRISSSIAIGAIGKATSGTLVLDDAATLLSDIRYLENSSRLLICGGSCWQPISVGLRMNGHTALSSYAVVCVTGACSRIEHASYDFTVRGSGAGLYALDGGCVTVKNLLIGGSSTTYGAGSSLESDRTRVLVDDGTVVTKEALKMGWDNDDDIKLSPRLVLAGTNGRVSIGGNLEIREKMDAEIEFVLPEAGYAETPLVAGGLSLIARGADKADYGPTHVKLTAVRAWARNHPEETIELVKLTTPNAAGLATLKASTVSDWRGITSDSLAVSEDGCKLTLTAPAKLGMMLIVR